MCDSKIYVQGYLTIVAGAHSDLQHLGRLASPNGLNPTSHIVEFVTDEIS